MTGEEERQHLIGTKEFNKSEKKEKKIQKKNGEVTPNQTVTWVTYGHYL